MCKYNYSNTIELTFVSHWNKSLCEKLLLILCAQSPSFDVDTTALSILTYLFILTVWSLSKLRRGNMFVWVYWAQIWLLYTYVYWKLELNSSSKVKKAFSFTFYIIFKNPFLLNSYIFKIIAQKSFLFIYFSLYKI